MTTSSFPNTHKTCTKSTEGPINASESYRGIHFTIKGSQHRSSPGCLLRCCDFFLLRSLCPRSCKTRLRVYGAEQKGKSRLEGEKEEREGRGGRRNGVQLRTWVNWSGRIDAEASYGPFLGRIVKTPKQRQERGVGSKGRWKGGVGWEGKGGEIGDKVWVVIVIHLPCIKI